MRLRTVTPPLPDELITALEECDIRTDADLMFSGSAIEIYDRISPCTTSLAELTQWIRQVTSAASNPGICGFQSYKREKARHEDYPTDDYSSGVSELDNLLGGFGGFRIIEISGDRGSGKSSLALQVALRHLASRPDSSALWIDTTGDFPPERIPLLVESCVSLAGAASAAARLQVALAFDIDAVNEALETLKSTIDIGPRTSLLVIDSLTSIFRPLLSAVSAQGHAIMAVFMRQLRYLTETRPLSILVLNGTSAVTPPDPTTAPGTLARKPALGPSFTYMTDATLWLSQIQPQSPQEGEETSELPLQEVYTAEVLRSKITPSQTQCSFRIYNGILRSLEDAQPTEE